MEGRGPHAAIGGRAGRRRLAGAARVGRKVVLRLCDADESALANAIVRSLRATGADRAFAATPKQWYGARSLDVEGELALEWGVPVSGRRPTA